MFILNVSCIIKKKTEINGESYLFGSSLVFVVVDAQLLICL